MKINFNAAKLHFKSALPTRMKSDYKNTVKQAKKALGIQDGISIFKIHSGSMPAQDTFDTGIGKLNSKPALDLIDTITFYTDTNAVKEFPKGQMTKHYDQYYCPYLKTAVTFGEENINLLNLVQDKDTYGELLSFDDIKDLNLNLGTKMIIYENELGTDENYPVLKPLRKAFDNFKSGENIPQKLKEDFEEYKKQPLVENTYTRLALYPFISQKEPDLFEEFDLSEVKQGKFEKYKEEFKDEIEFFKFRQFLAQKEHDSAKQKINDKGIDLFGDCLIGFSNQEVWAHPDAFLKNTCIGLYEWGLPALDFKQILDSNSESHKVFDDKISFFLKNYDGIRFDVGWCYAIARMGEKGKKPVDFDLGHELYDFIEKRALEIKGEDFNTHKLMYEVDGFPYLYKWDDRDIPQKEKMPPKILPNLKGITNILTTEWQHTENFGYGSPDFHLQHGLNEDELIMGTNNHDGYNLMMYGKTNHKDKNWFSNANILSSMFKIPFDDFFYDVHTFVKAKFAQIYTIKNQFLFQNDVFGTSRDMDSQEPNPEEYRTRFNKDFERQYHTALQYGTGFNLPESLRLAMIAKGIDKNNPGLYDKLEFYSNYLSAHGPLSEEEANEKDNCLQNK